MSSVVWAVPATRLREAHVLRFLKDSRYSVRLVEVSLFKEFIFDRVDARRWEPRGDLTKTAEQISKYIADGGCVEVRIVASDEV
jgi:hypothetical protein